MPLNVFGSWRRRWIRDSCTGHVFARGRGMRGRKPVDRRQTPTITMAKYLKRLLYWWEDEKVKRTTSATMNSVSKPFYVHDRFVANARFLNALWLLPPLIVKSVQDKTSNRLNYRVVDALIYQPMHNSENNACNDLCYARIALLSYWSSFLCSLLKWDSWGLL